MGLLVISCATLLCLIDLKIAVSDLRMLSRIKNRKLAAILAFVSIVSPVSGLHKFYLGQPLWGIVYLLLSWTPIPRVASAIEGAWYLAQDQTDFDQNFNLNGTEELLIPRPVAPPAPAATAPQDVSAIAEAVRQLDQLRQDGLISEYEFEQKRRQLLDRIG